jgi:hypothetical protein
MIRPKKRVSALHFDYSAYTGRDSESHTEDHKQEFANDLSDGTKFNL